MSPMVRGDDTASNAGRPVQIDTLLEDGAQGLAIAAAYAINDKGQIAAVQNLPDNMIQPLQLTPHRCHGK